MKYLLLLLSGALFAYVRVDGVSKDYAERIIRKYKHKGSVSNAKFARFLESIDEFSDKEVMIERKGNDVVIVFRKLPVIRKYNFSVHGAQLSPSELNKFAINICPVNSRISRARLRYVAQGIKAGLTSAGYTKARVSYKVHKGVVTFSIECVPIYIKKVKVLCKSPAVKKLAESKIRIESVLWNKHLASMELVEQQRYEILYSLQSAGYLNAFIQKDLKIRDKSAFVTYDIDHGEKCVVTDVQFVGEWDSELKKRVSFMVGRKSHATPEFQRVVVSEIKKFEGNDALYSLRLVSCGSSECVLILQKIEKQERVFKGFRVKGNTKTRVDAFYKLTRKYPGDKIDRNFKQIILRKMSPIVEILSIVEKDGYFDIEIREREFNSEYVSLMFNAMYSVKGGFDVSASTGVNDLNSGGYGNVFNGSIEIKDSRSECRVDFIDPNSGFRGVGRLYSFGVMHFNTRRFFGGRNASFEYLTPDFATNRLFGQYGNRFDISNGVESEVYVKGDITEYGLAPKAVMKKNSNLFKATLGRDIASKASREIDSYSCGTMNRMMLKAALMNAARNSSKEPNESSIDRAIKRAECSRNWENPLFVNEVFPERYNPLVGVGNKLSKTYYTVDGYICGRVDYSASVVYGGVIGESVISCEVAQGKTSMSFSAGKKIFSQNVSWVNNFTSANFPTSFIDSSPFGSCCVVGGKNAFNFEIKRDMFFVSNYLRVCGFVDGGCVWNSGLRDRSLVVGDQASLNVTPGVEFMFTLLPPLPPIRILIGVPYVSDIAEIRSFANFSAIHIGIKFGMQR